MRVGRVVLYVIFLSVHFDTDSQDILPLDYTKNHTTPPDTVGMFENSVICYVI